MVRCLKRMNVATDGCKMKAKKIKIGEVYVLKTGAHARIKERQDDTWEEKPSRDLGTDFVCDIVKNGVVVKKDVFVTSKRILRTLEHQKRIDAHHERLRAAKERKFKVNEGLAATLETTLVSLTGQIPDKDFTVRPQQTGVTATLNTQTLHELLYVLQILQSQAFAYTNLMNSQK